MTKSLYCFDHLIMLKEYNDPLSHSHLQKHLIFSLDDEITCHIEGVDINAKGICIGSNVYHRVISRGKRIIVFLIVEPSKLSQSISENILRGNDYSVVSTQYMNRIQKTIQTHNADIKDIDSAILSILPVVDCFQKLKDERIDSIIEIITKSDSIDGDTLASIQNTINLSKSRISHLFKKELGVSLSTYLMFEKMHKAFIGIMGGYDITTAAVNAGFSSSSHFAAVCKRRYGISFSNFKKDTEFIIR